MKNTSLFRINSTAHAPIEKFSDFFFIQQYENELFQQLSHFMVFAYVFFYLYKLSCKSNYIVPGIALYDMRKYMKIAGYYIYYFINEDTKDSHVEKCTKYRMECLCL